MPDLLVGSVLLLGGIVLVVWGAERFTDGAIATARTLGTSPFWIGAVVSGFEPENLVTGIAATAEGLSQIALGTVIGAAIFMLTAGLGLAVLIVPMEVRIPRAGGLAMLASLALFVLALWPVGLVSRARGIGLVLVAVGLMAWLYHRSPAFQSSRDADDAKPLPARRTIGLLVLGTVAIVAGAEFLVRGARMLLSVTGLSETFLGMTVVALGDSVEETARMVAPARRGHPELALGNVVGTLIVLLLFNLGVIALVRPLTADPFVLRFHVPYLLACAGVVTGAFLFARRLARPLGILLVSAYLMYLAVNLLYARAQ